MSNGVTIESPPAADPSATQLPSGRIGHALTGAQPAKFVVVHGGARDSYQLAQALSEAGMLEALVTDLFWPADRKWTRFAERLMPNSLRSLVRQRMDPELPSARVRVCAYSGLLQLLLEKIPRAPRSLRRRANRYADATLGRVAGRYA